MRIAEIDLRQSRGIPIRDRCGITGERTILADMRIALFLAVICTASKAEANDWLTLPSSFSHDVHGVRVAQYAAIDAPTVAATPPLQTSGYTHTRSSLNYGQSADNYHRVEEWGAPVRPYGEWRFPYRPYSTPYPNWGPPFAGLNLGFPFAGYGPAFGGGRGNGGRWGGGYRGGGPGGGIGGPGIGGPGIGGHWGNRPPNRRGTYERGYLGGGRWPSDRYRFDGRNFPASPLNPYPAGPGTPYPVAPYYDGYYPNYPQ